MKVMAPLLMTCALTFGLCPGTFRVDLDMHSETVEAKGSNYRRADVLIFIPVQVKEEGKVKLFSGLRKIASVEEEGGSFRVNLRLYSITNKTIDNAFVKQEIPKGSRFDENIKALKVLSRNPYISEHISLYPTDIRKNNLIIKLPPIKPGEELDISYSLSGKEKPPVPSVSGGTLEREDVGDPVYMLVGKYSFKFPFASHVIKDINFDNIREVIAGLNRAGLKPVVKIFGMADGKTKDPEKNMEVARKRASFVARKVLGENYACYIRRGFAGNIR